MVPLRLFARLFAFPLNRSGYQSFLTKFIPTIFSILSLPSLVSFPVDRKSQHVGPAQPNFFLGMFPLNKFNLQVQPNVAK